MQQGLVKALHIPTRALNGDISWQPSGDTNTGLVDGLERNVVPHEEMLKLERSGDRIWNTCRERFQRSTTEERLKHSAKA
ncbi:hypothetical protein IFR04_001835 [Cadophora malorum]|uniref:Uncharacterized protein n=1 Tax=Cadophora malorum TaxID=108018 RepID=A0A8H7WHR4_9HELO|nr:hypothetical protein IFR04_001835 [Cadophora malorum]